MRQYIKAGGIDHERMLYLLREVSGDFSCDEPMTGFEVDDHTGAISVLKVTITYMNSEGFIIQRIDRDATWPIPFSTITVISQDEFLRAGAII